MSSTLPQGRSTIVTGKTGRGHGLLVLQSVLRARASRGRPLDLRRVHTVLRTQNISTRHGDLCSSFRRLQLVKRSVIAIQSAAIQCCVKRHAFSLPRLHLLISTIRSSGFVATGGDRALVHGLRGLADQRRTINLRHRIIISHHVGDVGRDVCCGISTLRRTVTSSRRITFRCFS